MTGLEFALDIGIYRIILEGDFEILIKALKTGCGSLAQSGHIANDIHYLDCEKYIVTCFFVHKFMFFSYSFLICSSLTCKKSNSHLSIVSLNRGCTTKC